MAITLRCSTRDCLHTRCYTKGLNSCPLHLMSLDYGGTSSIYRGGNPTCAHYRQVRFTLRLDGSGFHGSFRKSWPLVQSTHLRRGDWRCRHPKNTCLQIFLPSRISYHGTRLFAMKEKSIFREQGGRIRQAVLIDTLQPEGR